MTRKYLRSPVTGKVLNRRKGQVYAFRITRAELRKLADMAERHPVVEWPIEEGNAVYSAVRFTISG